MRPLIVAAEPAFRTRHANPYNARLYWSMPTSEAHVDDLSYWRLATKRTDIVHLHWPDLTFLSGGKRWLTTARLSLFSAALAVARLRGTRVVWTAHNLVSHEERSTPRLRRWYRRMLTRNLDAVICLSDDGTSALRVTHPELAGVPVTVVPHGHYQHDYEFGISRNDARQVLGVDPSTVITASLGQMRPYKNLAHLIEVFRAMDDPHRDRRLVIAGKPADPALRAALEQARDGDERVVLEFGHLDDHQMVLWLAASDLVALPYLRIDNSGSAILALSADRPVLAPRLGALSELRDQVGDDWVSLYDGPLTTTVLSDALDRAVQRTFGDRPRLVDLEWGPIAQQTLEVYRAALSTPRVRGRLPSEHSPGHDHSAPHDRSAPHDSSAAPPVVPA